MSKRNDLRTIILICAAGLLINLVGAALAHVFNLPFYLDTCGTIFIAALGGYVPGIAVGFFTNLLTSTFDPEQMYYCSVNIAVAIITAFFARKGIFDNFYKMLLMIPMLISITGTCDVLIESFLETSDILRTVDEFNYNYVGNFLDEALDKTFSVLMTFVLLKMTPPHVRKSFLALGQRQAPLSEEMKAAVSKQNHLISSLRTKTLALLTLSSLLLSFSIALISYLLYKNSAVDERIKTVDGMLAVAISEINPDQVDNYIKYGRAAGGYIRTEEKLTAIKNSSMDIKYLYVYKILEDGCHVVFDLDTATLEADNAGSIVMLDSGVVKYRDDLLAGRPIPPIITDDEYGYLLTLYKPLYDESGKCQCYVVLDFSLDALTEYTHNFIIKLLALFAGCFVFIFATGLGFVENNIILPVNTMAWSARNFSYDNPTAREKHIALIKSLQIHTGDEIENLYRSLLRTTENVVNYLEHLQRAKRIVADIQGKFIAMDNLAHKDSLTGVQNKNAYVETIAKLDEKISDGVAQFCIVMVDVNFLKRVNDNYGHEHGNIYLMNTCKLVCAVFGEENVYRIGGDEFVVILEGEKVSLVKYFMLQFKSEMDRKLANENLALWEKVSAAVGVAIYKADVDKTADEVFKRADKEMYANKLAMKASRT